MGLADIRRPGYRIRALIRDVLAPLETLRGDGIVQLAEGEQVEATLRVRQHGDGGRAVCIGDASAGGLGRVGVLTAD